MVDCNMGQEGEMQSELKASEFIDDVVCGGPKILIIQADHQ